MKTEEPSMSMMLNAGLTVAERAKFGQVELQMAAVFAAHGHVIRFCTAAYDNECRMIDFRRSPVAHRLVALPADQFLNASADELLRDLAAVLKRIDA